MHTNLMANRDGGLVEWAATAVTQLARVVTVVGLFCAAQARGQTEDAVEDSRTLIDLYCVDCHSGSAPTGDLALDSLNADNPIADQGVWERVISKLRHRRMPPLDYDRPSEATYETVISQLETSLDCAAESNPNPGRTDTFRRLTRTEYRNAIRDLLGLDLDVSALLPKDESSHGFDNITVGELSPTLLQRYLSAAKRISHLAIGGPVRSPRGTIIKIPLDLTQANHLDGLPFGTRGGAVVRHNFPLDGEYEIRLRLTRNRNERVEGLSGTHEVELLLDGKLVQKFAVKPPRGGASHTRVDAHLEVRILVKAGQHDLGATFVEKSAALPESERQPYLAQFSARHGRTEPALYSISILGPYATAGPGETSSRSRVFVCYPSNESEQERCATVIISTLMRRAYRRSISKEEITPLFRLYNESSAQGGFEAGIETALRAILVNPQYLFRIELDPSDVPANTTYRLSDVELASRLSFFLWSSIPDDELLEVADRGDLGKPDTLQRQVRRMLADRRSETLVSNFAAQWLYLRNLEFASPDARMFPDFDDNLRQALRRETELLVGSIVGEDRNVLDLLRADYTFVNERLAKHYGIPHVYGSRFRRIDLGQDRVRGGLLRQGSILTVTSYANRTSPVVRGKWVLTNILGTPPPLPPPNVPPLEEKKANEKLLSLRERIVEHRANRVCATCHNLIDPVGFALENYDAIGRWRTEDDGFPVDATGSLPDGSEFDGVSELQEILLQRPEIFVGTLAGKLLTYSLGRGLEHYDAPAIRKVVRDARKDDYRFSALILGIVNSTPFQMRRTR